MIASNFGAGNFGSPTQLLILLAIVVLLFGGKRLRSLGGDLGGAIKGFKNSLATASAETSTEVKKDESVSSHRSREFLDGATELDKSRHNVGG